MTVTTSEAAAYRGGPTSPINQVANKELVRAIIADIDAQGLNSATTANGRTAIYRAQVAGGRFVALGTVGSIALGSVIVWKIADTAGLGGFVYKKITGHGFTVVGAGTVSAQYGANCGDSFANSSSVYPGVPVWCYYNGYTGNVHPGASHPGPWAGAYTNAKALMAQFSAIGTFVGGSSACQSGGVSVHCGVRFRTAAEFEEETGIKVEPATAAEFAAAGSGQRTAGTNAQPGSNTVTDGELAAALAALGADDGVDRSGGTDAGKGKEDAVDVINEEIEPGYSAVHFSMPDCLGLALSTCTTSLTTQGHTGTITELELDFEGAIVTRPAATIAVQSIAPGTMVPKTDPLTLTLNPAEEDYPILLPAPNGAETYDDYIDRLRIAGWVGTATVTTLSEAAGEPSLGPDAPVTVRIPAIETVGPRTLKLPGGWPTPNPRVKPDTTVTFTKNPTTYAPVPPESVPPPGGGGGGPPGSIDFSPLSDIDPGCKFPYGFICYAIDVTEWFNVAPAAPVFSFTIPDVDVLGTTYHVAAPYEVDLDVMSGHMAIIRSLMSVAMWVGAVYWLAVRLLGFNAGGDPGEAVDEGFTT